MPTLFYYYYCCCCCCSCCSCCCCAPAAEGRIVEIDFTKLLLLLKRPGIDIIHWQSKEHSLPAREHNDRCRGSGALSMLRLINGSKFHWNYCWQNCIFFLHSNSKDKFEQYKLKKSVDGVLGTRTRGDGRHRRIQGAMAAPRNTSTLSSEKYLEIFFLISVLGLTLTIGWLGNPIIRWKKVFPIKMYEYDNTFVIKYWSFHI